MLLLQRWLPAWSCSRKAEQRQPARETLLNVIVLISLLTRTRYRWKKKLTDCIRTSFTQKLYEFKLYEFIVLAALCLACNIS